MDWILLLAVGYSDEATISEPLSGIHGNRSAEFGAVAFQRSRLKDLKYFLLPGQVFQPVYYSLRVNPAVKIVIHPNFLAQRGFGSGVQDSKGIEYS